ncbi:MAG: glycosyl hydrolase family 2 [Bacteroidales bacterium]|nr:glycosyl hydrolase family 2 [Bacteroidales bacterium]
MKNYLIIILLITFSINSIAQPVFSTFELRYFSSDPKANGETDFKGETEWLDTEGRVAFLKDYANYASLFFGNPDLDKKIVSDDEINQLIRKIKPQPATNIRRTILLNGWKSYGYRHGQDQQRQQALKKWGNLTGVHIANGKLELDQTTIEKKFEPITWRFKLKGKIKLFPGSKGTLKLTGNGKTAVLMDFSSQQLKQEETEFIIEGDLTKKRFNSYIDGKLIHDFTLMADTSVTSISAFSVSSTGKCFLDDLFLFSHTPRENANYPYISSVLLDENFEVKPAADGWQSFDFDDSHWKEADLPAVHGGLREKEEFFYLRKKIFVDDFEQAFLQMETLDPGGEVWVNNQVVAVVNNRHPQEIEITKFLKKGQENIIAVKVNPYKLSFPMGHTPTDHHIGWFLGRTKLLLTSKCRIKEMKVFTQKLGKEAFQSHNVTFQYPGRHFFEGSVEINYYPWFPEEGELVASFTRNVKIRPSIEDEFQFKFSVPAPQPWSPGSPRLYKVEVILKDKEGKAVDDYIITTGIRTVTQANGHLYINGKPEMLNGAQIMGLRTPIETIAKHNRCAPPETVAEEMLMIKKMDANLLRVHVHAEKDTADGINDPRYAEFADQMGIYLIWSTAAFIREGEGWNIDFEGYPKFMKQVINHPSIVIWEASNHPNRFKLHDIDETHEFVKRVYQKLSETDQSRLISPTSFWQHTHYANYDGSLDYQGNSITPVSEYMAELNTRGSQDAYTGYGAEWSKLRNAPNDWAASCLAANDKAYFNFEHAESIGQPNWELSKGKPWYLVHSYEWDYDKGSIGRRLTSDEWRESQAWQAFSAWESMKKQMLLGYDGFSWCTIRGGANMGTYQKPLIDNLRHPKLAWYTNKMVFQKTWAASNNVDVVYGPDDVISPVIHHIGDSKRVDLTAKLQTLQGETLEIKLFKNIELEEGRGILQLEGFRFEEMRDGIYAIKYELNYSKTK